MKHRIRSARGRARAVGLGLALAALAASVPAQTVSFSGLLGDKALLVIDGQARGVAVGATVQGVRLVRLDGTQAQVEVGGRTQFLRLGGAAVVAGDTGAAGGGSRIVLAAGTGGHYLGLGTINGRPMHFVVDTGATSVTLGAEAAAQLGIDLRGSSTGAISTANGVVPAHRVVLAKVSVGEVTVYNVEAVVVPQGMPLVLLGNSFLSHFQMHSDGGSLVLEKKN